MPSGILSNSFSKCLALVSTPGLGALAWVIFCLVAVALRGIRWDEQYEMAQIVLGMVRYPDGHPALLCTRNALNAQIFTSAGLLWATESAAWVCGFRNVFFLAATVLPVYAMAWTLSGSVLCGHIATALALSGMHEAFAGCYPLSAWPGYFSTGHTGQGIALLVLWLMFSGHTRLGAFCLGLMPCMHIGQMPLLLGWAVLATLFLWRKVESRALLCRALAWFLGGLALCALVWLARGWVAAPEAQGGGYAVTGDAAAIWRGYVAHDAHRALPGGPIQYTNAFFVLAALLLLSAAARGVRLSSCHAGLLLYALGIAAAVWGIMPLHAWLGEETPYWMLGWMPYRFTNQAAILLLPLMAAWLWRPNAKIQGHAVLMATMALLLFRPVSAWMLPEEIQMRYMASGEGVFFFLCGGALALAWLRLTKHPRFRIAWSVLTFFVTLVLGTRHQFGAACLLAGGAFGCWSALRLAQRQGVARAASVLCALLLLVLLTQQARAYQFLPVTTFDQAVRARLEGEHKPQAMLLARPDQFTAQARLGHPFFTDGALPGWIPYMPSLGPVLNAMHQDVYGIDLSGQAQDSHPWQELWASRAHDKWLALSTRYGFEYVLAPANLQLTLTPLLRGEREILYGLNNDCPNPVHPPLGR